MTDDRQLSDLNALLDVSRELGATTELVPLLEKVEHAIRQVLECDRATVFLFDRAADELYSVVATGEKGIRFSARLGIAGEALQGQTVVNVPDAYADARFNRAIDKATGYRTRNLLTFPMPGYDGRVVGVLQALNKQDGPFDACDEARASDLAMLAGVAIQRQMLLDEYAEKQQLERDLSLARDIQQRLLPRGNPSVRGYDIAGYNKPADATGGDCYDYVSVQTHSTGFLLADVTGHGVGPALIAAECRALVRAFSLKSSDPAEVLRETNRVLCDDLDSGRFVTAFFGILDPDAHIVRFLSAGHGPILHYRRLRGRCDELPATTYPLGIVPELDSCESQVVPLARGDMLVLTTDGLFEWHDPDGDQYGLERLNASIHDCRDMPADALIHELHRRVVAFGRGTPQADDITAIIVKRV
ncbi:MAG: SpoIIE family protein phosphatase [Phycisphaerales bacterium]|nr:SpoIIE family protein phosphatase [Phycisphaerales bacterium]